MSALRFPVKKRCTAAQEQGYMVQRTRDDRTCEGRACIGRCGGAWVDLNRNAHRIVAALAGEKPRSSKGSGRSGGIVGGPARAKVLSPERRKEIAVIASVSRWKNKEKN